MVVASACQRLARPSASSPWRRPSANAPSALRGPRQPRLGPDPQVYTERASSRCAASTLHRCEHRRPAKSPIASYTCPRLGMLRLQGRPPSAAASSRACWPPAMAGHTWSPICLSTIAIWASTCPSRARSSSALVRASASPNSARRRSISPSEVNGRSTARRRSIASTLVSLSSGRCARA